MDLLTFPDWAFVVLALALGPIAGSFIGLLSLRLPVGAPVVLARSACGHCGRTLGLRDLAPVVSALVSRGRCRSCGGAIPRRYLALELGCAGLAGWGALVHPGPVALLSAVLAWQLLLLALLDAEHFWLPRALTVPLAVTGLTAALPQGLDAIAERVIGVAVGFGILVLIAAAYRRLRGREGLGGGDAYMLAGAGAWVGWMGLPTVLVWASLAGLSVAAARLLTGGAMRPDARLPFGVFLAIGTWLTWLYGPLGRF